MKRYLDDKRRGLLVLIVLLLTLHQSSLCQVYNPVNYNFNGTPTYGVKIKTNLPYVSGSQMPTIIIEGYNYGEGEATGLILTWYIYNNFFYNPKISSFGADVPTVKFRLPDFIKITM